MSTQPQNALLYGLADMFNTNIYKFEGQYRGLCPTDFHLDGFCLLTSQITICADEVSDNLVTAFAHIRKELWAYVVITPAGRWLLFFNNSATKIRPGAEREFGHGNGMATVKKLRASITEARMWEHNEWKPVDPALLLAL